MAEVLESRFGIFSVWRKFPDPRRGELLIGPFGAGCYELRLADTVQLILFGCSNNVCWRLTSLLPAPHGQGTRMNVGKRDYVWENLDRIEYRTMSCASIGESRRAEAALRESNTYAFPT